MIFLINSGIVVFTKLCVTGGAWATMGEHIEAISPYAWAKVRGSFSLPFCVNTMRKDEETCRRKHLFWMAIRYL